MEKKLNNPYRDLLGRFCSPEEGLRANQYRKWVKLGHNAEAYNPGGNCPYNARAREGDLRCPSPAGLASDLQYHGKWKWGS